MTRFAGRNRLRAALWPDGGEPPAAGRSTAGTHRPRASPRAASASRARQRQERLGRSARGEGRRRTARRRASTPRRRPRPHHRRRPHRPHRHRRPPPRRRLLRHRLRPQPTYTSGSALEHWWRPGWDVDDLGRDFAASGRRRRVRATRAGSSAATWCAPARPASEVDLDGKKEALGNFKLAHVRRRPTPGRSRPGCARRSCRRRRRSPSTSST